MVPGLLFAIPAFGGWVQASLGKQNSDGSWAPTCNIDLLHQCQGSTPAKLRVSIDTSQLPRDPPPSRPIQEGTFAYDVRVSSAGAENSPQPVRASVAVRSLSITPSALHFVYKLGDAAPPGPQYINVAPTCGQSPLIASVTSDGSWLSFSAPSPGDPNNIYGPVRLMVAVNPAGLRPDSYIGRVKLQGARLDSAQSVAVSLDVTTTDSPSIANNGVLSAASFLPGMAFGGWVAIFGQNLASIQTK